MDHALFSVRCRALVMDEGKLLAVQHVPEATWWALPGGHAEYGEGMAECLVREMVEELGVVPEVGRLLYVNTFGEKDSHNVEFIFEILNGRAYRDLPALSGTHRHELAAIRWLSPTDDVRILPARIGEDFKNGTIGAASPVFIVDN